MLKRLSALEKSGAAKYTLTFDPTETFFTQPVYENLLGYAKSDSSRRTPVH